MSDLELLPAHLDVGMGVVDVRTEQLQSVEEIEALAAVGRAAHRPAADRAEPRLRLRPGAGEPPTIDEAYEKLRRLTDAAARLRARFASV